MCVFSDHSDHVTVVKIMAAIYYETSKILLLFGYNTNLNKLIPTKVTRLAFQFGLFALVLRPIYTRCLECHYKKIQNSHFFTDLLIYFDSVASKIILPK